MEPERLDDRDGQRAPDDAGDDPDERKLPQQNPEDRPLRPAERPQRADLAPPRAGDNERAVGHEERTHDEHEREQRQTLTVEGVQEDHRHVLLRPPLPQQQRRLPEAPLRQRDQHRMRRGPHGHVDVEARLVVDLLRHHPHPLPAHRIRPPHAGHSHPDHAQRRAEEASRDAAVRIEPAATPPARLEEVALEGFEGREDQGRLLHVAAEVLGRQVGVPAESRARRGVGRLELGRVVGLERHPRERRVPGQLARVEATDHPQDRSQCRVALVRRALTDPQAAELHVRLVVRHREASERALPDVRRVPHRKRRQVISPEDAVPDRGRSPHPSGRELARAEDRLCEVLLREEPAIEGREGDRPPEDRPTAPQTGEEVGARLERRVFLHRKLGLGRALP